MPSCVLVVDDDARIRRMLTMVLHEGGYEVETAADGLEALRKVESGSPALLLVDIQMPGIDGLELLRRLGDLPSAPPTIVVSAQVGAARQARSLGALEFIAKPFDVDWLLSVIERTLGTEERTALPVG
jgi:CheY-like chemotaxis protein